VALAANEPVAAPGFNTPGFSSDCEADIVVPPGAVENIVRQHFAVVRCLRCKDHSTTTEEESDDAVFHDSFSDPQPSSPLTPTLSCAVKNSYARRLRELEDQLASNHLTYVRPYIGEPNHDSSGFRATPEK
jgi:hypothetical protein